MYIYKHALCSNRDNFLLLCYFSHLPSCFCFCALRCFLARRGARLGSSSFTVVLSAIHSTSLLRLVAAVVGPDLLVDLVEEVDRVVRPGVEQVGGAQELLERENERGRGEGGERWNWGQLRAKDWLTTATVTVRSVSRGTAIFIGPRKAVEGKL